MSKFTEIIVGERAKITTRQEFIEKAREAFMFGVTEMDALTTLAADAYCHVGMTWEEFAEILSEGGYTPWVARSRAKDEWELHEKYDLCNETTAD